MFQRLNEKRGISSVWNSDGELLWEEIFDTGFMISPSGNYLISNINSMEVSRFKVLDIKTGRILLQENTSRWRASAARNDQLVYSDGIDIELFDLAESRLLWQKKLNINSEIQGYSSLYISMNGNRIAYQEGKIYRPNDYKKHTLSV